MKELFYVLCAIALYLGRKKISLCLNTTQLQHIAYLWAGVWLLVLTFIGVLITVMYVNPTLLRVIAWPLMGLLICLVLIGSIGKLISIR